MTIKNTPLLATVLSSVIGLLVLQAPALAEGNGRTIALIPKYQQECSSCHIAYSPALMPAPSWARIFGNLQKHFGVDASLDPATTKELASWVNTHAGTYKRVSEEPPQDRITRTAWFIRMHDEVSASTWKLPSVKSAANCTACHTTADKGDFNERNVRVPR
jgi:hypothetical protein